MNDTHPEPLVTTVPPRTLSIDGSAMKVLKAACDRFASAGKDMAEFTIVMSEDDDSTTDGGTLCIVTFMGKLLPGKKPALGNANRVPGSVTYVVCRHTFEVLSEKGCK